MQNDYSASGYWKEGFDEDGLQGWAENLRQRLGAAPVDLGLLFMSPEFFARAEEVLEIIRVHAKLPLLAGCSSQSLIQGDQELEDTSGMVLGLFRLPGAKLAAHHFTQDQVSESSGPGYWHGETGVGPEETNGWLVFADPFHLDCEHWLKQWNEAYPSVPILGGLASGSPQTQATQVYANGQVFDEGGIAISLGGAVELAGMISQGCTPIGETWTITKAEQNLIHEIGNRPAYQILEETFKALSPREQHLARGNLFLGMVTNEYLENFGRGDFLIRNLIGADPNSGTLAVGAHPRPGQTVQFQRRDAASSTEDMTHHLTKAGEHLSGRTIYGGCLCSCNGRGHRLFGTPHHDARHVQQYLGPFGLAGFFCNGEIGPVGEKNFLHGYTASLALFVSKKS